MYANAGNVAGYIRISSDKQDTRRQRDSIERWAELNGETIALWFEDSEGKNARDQAHKRQAFQRMLKAVEAGLVDCIVVDSQDRFGTKDAYQWGGFIDQLREHGCRLLDASGKDLSADDDAAVLTGTIGAMTSTREQKEKAKRNIGGKLTKAKEGEYQGGYPPYAFDVVCFGPNGDEKWRTLYVGHHKRLKVYPDGRNSEQFDGKDNSPSKDPHDTLRYRPSIEQERIKISQQAFQWYADEAISPKQIADRFNVLKVDPVFGEAWHKIAITQLLKNPIYIGIPTWNKRAGSRFYEFVGGLIREVTKTNGKVKMGRKRESSDLVQPTKPEFEPLVTAEVWNKVQEKIKAASGTQTKHPKRAANTAELWLKPLLFCAMCGKPMRATRGEFAGEKWPSYFCGNYGTYGKDNPTGCRCHRVKHDLIEKIVVDYLAKTSPQVRKLLDATETGNLDLIQPLIQTMTDAVGVEQSVASDVLDFVIKHLPDEEISKRLKSGQGFDEIYGMIYSRLKPSVEGVIADKERELDVMLEDYRKLTPKLRERVNSKMESLADEIQGLRQQLVDLRQPWQHLRKELAARKGALENATKLLRKDGNYRQKTDALHSVIDRINCHFRHTGKHGTPTAAKSFLDSVEIVPISGEHLIVTLEASPGPN